MNHGDSWTDSKCSVAVRGQKTGHQQENRRTHIVLYVATFFLYAHIVYNRSHFGSSFTLFVLFFRPRLFSLFLAAMQPVAVGPVAPGTQAAFMPVWSEVPVPDRWEHLAASLGWAADRLCCAALTEIRAQLRGLLLWERLSAATTRALED